MSEQMLRLVEVCKHTGHSRSWVYRAMQRGEFPRPRQTGPGSVRWLLSEIESWMQELPTSKDASAQARG